MTIAGLDGRAEARILSKDHSGPTTRLVRLPAGWGTGSAGAFTADLELFIIDGQVTLAGETLGQNDYGAVRSGQVICGLSADIETVALLMTSAPLRYDTSIEREFSEPIVGRPAKVPWVPIAELPGRFVCALANGPHGEVWLSGATEWTNVDGLWHLHDAAEEMFVLDGTLTIIECLGVGGQANTYVPGSYVYRPAGVWHGGPGSSSSEMAIAFHRIHGVRAATWDGADEFG